MLWKVKAPSGINGFPSVAGDTLYIGAGIPLGSKDSNEFVAYSLGSG